MVAGMNGVCSCWRWYILLPGAMIRRKVMDFHEEMRNNHKGSCRSFIRVPVDVTRAKLTLRDRIARGFCSWEVAFDGEEGHA